MAPACGPPASLEPPAGSRGSAERAVLFFSPVSAQSREAASSGPESSGPGSESMAEMERSDGRTRAIRGVPARGTVSCSAQPTATAAEKGPLDARVVEANGGVADASREQQEPREGWMSSESAGTASRPAVKRKGAGGGSDDAVGYEATRESGRRLTCPMGGDAPTGLPSNTSGSVVASAAGRATMRSRAEQKNVTVGGIYHLLEPTLVPIMSRPLLPALC